MLKILLHSLKHIIKIKFKFLYILFIGIIVLQPFVTYAQEVPIISYDTNAFGQVQLTVASTADNYYILKIRTEESGPFNIKTSITLGNDGNTVITEPLGYYPIEHYQVLEYAIDAPIDSDGDGVDDITELNNMPTMGPLNSADPVDESDGLLVLKDFDDFKKLSITNGIIQWSEFLNGKGYAKFIIDKIYSDNPKVYFIDSDKHKLHADFAEEIEADFDIALSKKGQIIHHPITEAPNGTAGSYSFNFSNGFEQDFDVVQRCHEILAANMPYLNNNLSYYVTENSEEQYVEDKDLYDASRIPILFEEDIFGEIDYWGLNQAEGYGLLKNLEPSENPGPIDVVIYEAIPNSLPRVGGIITTVLQTPLSHVNLRAIQDDIPNAFIRNALEVDSVTNLIGKYVHYKVEENGYLLEEATLDEVNDWFDEIRPEEEQNPPLNLDYTSILPLDEISFEMYDGFGAKTANLATMRTFDFPEDVIPDGYGVPFYFYQEFMKHHKFFEEVSTMISMDEFKNDRDVRDEMLKDFRKKIKDVEMPQWMLDELEEMHMSFPAGTAVRCRSSTNNEDLPDFNGAGLYDSKTQHLDEGHISKSIKQVYASLWNLRAFDQREFYRVNHFTASMGVLCHPNFSNEKANGVGVSIDPIYDTENTFYLNSQVGEELITNPTPNAVPEEILLDRYSVSDNDYVILLFSNLIPDNEVIMKEEYLDLMREYLTVIHDEFEILYNAEGRDDFAMDIEYKITQDERLAIKQARPWVTFGGKVSTHTPHKMLDANVFPNPSVDNIIFKCLDCPVESIYVTDVIGSKIAEVNSVDFVDGEAKISVVGFAPGIYVLTAIGIEGNVLQGFKFVKE